jgi:ketosteroid isomerase-like protein
MESARHYSVKPGMTNAEVVRRSFEAFQAREREAFAGLLAEGFRFSSPHDPDLDQDGYFERCWQNMEHMRSIELERVVESGDEVFVRYLVERTSGERFRNVELHTVRDGRIERVEVYYGAELG